MFTALLLVEPLLEWLQSTGTAQAIAQSLMLTGFLSSVHLLGLMLVVGGALVSSLRLLGIMLADVPISSVAGPTGRGIVAGLLISVTTGFLLVSPRALAAFDNGFFQIKMVLLLAAVLLHVTLFRRVTRQVDVGPLMLKATGALGLGLWGGVAAAGCAYILLEY
jgi:hypothetical protein